MKRLLLLVVVVLALPTAATATVDRGTAGHLQVASTTTTDAPNVAGDPLPDPDATDGSSSWLLVLMAIIVVAMVVLAVAFVRGRRPPA